MAKFIVVKDREIIAFGSTPGEAALLTGFFSFNKRTKTLKCKVPNYDEFCRSFSDDFTQEELEIEIRREASKILVFQFPINIYQDFFAR